MFTNYYALLDLREEDVRKSDCSELLIVEHKIQRSPFTSGEFQSSQPDQCLELHILTC